MDHADEADELDVWSMGSSIYAIIEIDHDGAPNDEPFKCYPGIWSLIDDVGFSHAKDYELFAAMCGVRNQSGKTPLFPGFRGFPKGRHDQTFATLGAISSAESITWLTYAEIQRALHHWQLDRERLSGSACLVLDVLKTISDRYGTDRVRLVYHIDSI